MLCSVSKSWSSVSKPSTGGQALLNINTQTINEFTSLPYITFDPGLHCLRRLSNVFVLSSESSVEVLKLSLHLWLIGLGSNVVNAVQGCVQLHHRLFVLKCYESDDIL